MLGEGNSAMKINFDGTYKEVSRLVAAPVSLSPNEGKPAEFSKLLAAISPDTQQPTDISGEGELAPRPITGGAAEVRARLKFETPALTVPIPETIPPEETMFQPIEGNVGGVKTPSVVGVKRIKSAEAFNSLPRSERIDEVSKLVSAAGLRHGVDPALSIAVVAAESGFDAAAISADGHASKGLMQLLDGTGKHLLKHAGLEAQYDPFNPSQNIDLGVGYLRKLHDTFSKSTELTPEVTTVAAANSSSLEKLAVAAFNAGEGRVAAAQERAKKAGLNPALYLDVEGYLPKSTQEYVGKVMQLKTTFEPEPVG
ncbi:MAG: hypothetical protein RL417_208 [Pseudomonadota bacterium]